MTTAPLFLAPPAPPASATPSASRTPDPAKDERAPLRMTKGARAAVSGMKISEADIQACLDGAEDVEPDRKPGCTRFRRGALTVVTGADGVVLRVNRGR